MSQEIPRNPNLELNDVATKHKDKIHKTIKVIEHLVPNQQELDQVPDHELRGLLQQRLLNIESLLTAISIALTKTVPVYERFYLEEATTTITLKHTVNLENPIWVTYETLPQKFGTDYIIQDNVLHWINTVDAEIFGDFEITYYRA